MSEKKKVVAVGGGTGMYTLLRGLRNYSDQLDISAVVTRSYIRHDGDALAQVIFDVLHR